jgi:hypothetical protein
MPLIALDIPPGVYANGTDYEASGRWLSASLVRWHNGSMRPVGGWRERLADLSNSAARGMIAWEDNTNGRWIAAGSYNKLFVTNASNTITDITPTGFTSGLLDAAVNTGFSGGFYGLSYYGTPRPDTGNFSEATTWSLDNWGEYLVACSNADGKLYEWQLNTANPAAVIANAPTNNSGLMVTEERFLFALGAGGVPRKVQWCDREDNTLWTPDTTNEAGDIELQTSGQIMAGVRTRGQALILTDIDAHSANYIGPPFVYGFERVGTSCGLAARLAAVNTDAGVFWMGQNGFFNYNGTTVQEIPCEVQDYVFTDINRAQISKCWAMQQGQFGEVWWFYPSSGSTEIDRYVAYDFKEGHWMTGELSRTSGVERGVFKYPLMMNTTGDVIEHEVGLNYDGATIFAESGPISIGAGDQTMSVRQLIPDEKTLGDVSATFQTRFYPTDTERTYGPYTMSNPTSVRFSGRQVRMRIEGNRLADWRVGTMRVDAVARGRR